MEKKITVSRKKAKKLTVSRKKAKILTVNRKSYYPIETLFILISVKRSKAGSFRVLSQKKICHEI